MKLRCIHVFFAAAMICSPQIVAASSFITAPSVSAMNVQGDVPRIDGKLDEIVWRQAPVASNFVQLQPVEGNRATERSEVRVLYAHDALYVGFRAWDTQPDAIEGQLTRRDQGSYSDWVHVAVDSYYDRRTAFQFGVNPVGVKRDSYRYNDTHSDSDWDAVWDVATAVDDSGWTAEFRIPYSQLRFDDSDQQIWGIQFMRWIARKDEASYWSPISGDDNAMVSRFGDLKGVKGIRPNRRLEVTPYALTLAQRAPGDKTNPFYEEVETRANAGLDIKYGLTSNLTLDLTINPDFGQVEADPARVNLSDFESFFPERRPFFLEGANIFDFSIGDGNRLFHSRRIGRAPQGHADAAGGYVDTPQNTTITGAAKLTGKTQGDVTIGMLYASTAEEQASIITADGDAWSQVIEPATHYGVLRLQKDLREGRSVIGLIATGMSRAGEDADALGLHHTAVTGGLDFQHRFGNDDYRISGNLLGSVVSGSPNAIARTQRAPARYLQRRDADHLTYDPTLESLTGANWEINVGKDSGGFWRYGVGYRARTPGFEANDMGFMNRADFRIAHTSVDYDHYLPTNRLRQWRVRWNAWRAETTGGERFSLGTSVNAKFQLKNHTNLSASGSYYRSSFDVTALRGGPSIRNSDRFKWSVGVNTDSREVLVYSFKASGSASRDGSGSTGFSPSISWRPVSNARVSVGISYSRNNDTTQWVDQIDREDRHYILGRIAQESLSMTMRLDYAFTRNLSLEFYAQPFIAAGAYDEFKRVSDPLATGFNSRFQRLETQTTTDGFLSDVDGDGTPEFISDPSFNYKQFRSNTVLRWEYNPGSALFLVWSHGRQDYVRNGDFNPRNDLGRLINAPSDNVIMMKVNCWLNPAGWFKG